MPSLIFYAGVLLAVLLAVNAVLSFAGGYDRRRSWFRANVAAFAALCTVIAYSIVRHL